MKSTSAIPSAGPSWTARPSPDKWKRAWTRHDLLRFARLCHYLRARQPDAQIGYSILIYRLSAAEIAAASTGTLAEWRAAIAHPAAVPAR